MTPNDVADIQATLNTMGVPTTPEQIKSRLDQLMQFRVTGLEARRNVIRSLAKAAGVDPKTLFKASSPPSHIGEINAEGQWVSLKAKVVQLWEPTSEKISQTGLVGDPTGIIKFTVWETAKLPPMQEGSSYLIESAVTSRFNERYQLNLNKNTTITPLQEDIQVTAREEQFTGAIVDIQSGSGLIKRCPECNRQTRAGTCGEHGRVEGYYDLRTKAVIDNGLETKELLLDAETTQLVTGINLEKAKEMAMAALDQTAAQGEIAEILVGKYYEAKGSAVGRYLLVKTMTPTELTLNAKEILATLEAI